MEEQVRHFLVSLEEKLTYSTSTRLAYDNDLRCFMSFLASTLDRPPVPADFTQENIVAFLNAERTAGRRHSTLLRRRASLRRFAIFLGQQNPNWSADLQASHLIDEAIAAPSPLVLPRYLTEDQVGSLWTVMEASSRPRTRRDQAILALLLESGLTVGTLIAFDLQDVNLEQGKLRLSLGRTNKEHWISLGDAAQPIRRYMEEGRPELNYQLTEPALFISQTGGRMSRQGVWQVLSQWGSRAGLPMTLSSRLVRHTAAFRLARSGRPLQEIQMLLGHSNPLSTQALLRRLATFGEEQQAGLSTGTSHG